jgi:hypothetical protein
MSEVAEMAQGKDANFGKITGQLRASSCRLCAHNSAQLNAAAPQESGAIHELHAPHH